MYSNILAHSSILFLNFYMNFQQFLLKECNDFKILRVALYIIFRYLQETHSIVNFNSACKHITENVFPEISIFRMYYPFVIPVYEYAYSQTT